MDRRRTSSAARVLVVVLEIVAWKTVDRRQAGSAAQVPVVVLEIVCKTVNRRRTSSAARVLVVVLEIVAWKTVDRRQTGSAAQVLIVVLETRRPRRPGDIGDPETLETHSHSETLETRRPGDIGDPETLETRRPGDLGDPQPLGDTGDPETSETQGTAARLLDSVNSTQQCSWRNNSGTATSVNCRWTSASVRRDVDHPHGYVISRWIAAWIALH